MKLADLIIEQGPFVAGGVMPFPTAPNGHPIITAAEINELRDELIAARAGTTYEEWRVTGDPGGGFPPYNFTWSPFRNPHLGEAEAGARGFVALIKRHGDSWPDGPHLHKRTVTVTEWEAVEDTEARR